MTLRRCLMAVLCFLLVPAAAAHARDVRANNPDLGPVALTLPDSAPDVFPTNKQNEPSIAFNAAEFTASPSASAGYHMVAGTNDEQEQPKCGPGPRRGADAPLSDCSFFPGVGTNGVYTVRATAARPGATRASSTTPRPGSRPTTSPTATRSSSPGPRPGANGRFSYANGARFYYVSLAHEKQASSPGGKGGNEQIVVSYNDNNGAIANWSKPVVATRSNPITFNDKNSGWVDRNPNSPYFGNLYVGFTMFRSATAQGQRQRPDRRDALDRRRQLLRQGQPAQPGRQQPHRQRPPGLGHLHRPGRHGLRRVRAGQHPGGGDLARRRRRPTGGRSRSAR